ncbi:MAG TPA: TonB-dependent receptor, partial [Thermoanaerobaculia bacterium]|nr:TonB-dependent receptor [Thermoanaerobaculia bacterium]
MTSRRFTCALLIAAAMLAPAVAFGQLQTGGIYGAVVDDKQQPIPGVTLTLTGVGGPKTAQSDAAGRFRFVGLYPGEYALHAELEGFPPYDQTGIGVRLGANVQLEVVLVGAVEETITVTSEAALINPRDLNQGPVLSQQELDKIPTARDPWSLLAQAPGVIQDRINVGGNESGQQADFAAAGATTTDNTFAVDGVVLTDMAAVGGSATYFDFGAYEEVQLTTASTDVTIQTAGVTINQVTKRGTNTWRGDGRYLRTEGSWQADPKEADGNQIDSVEEYGANFGGPLWRDHLWAWASYGESDIGNIAQGGQLDHTELEDLNSKVNFQFGPNSGVLHFWTNDKLKDGRNAGPLFAPESTWDQTTPQDIWKIEDTHVFGSNFYLTALFSEDDGAFTLAPKGGLDADFYYDNQGVAHGSYWDFDQTATITQYKAEGNSFFDTGTWSHELKFGAGYREQENDSISVLPRGRYVWACEDYGCAGDEEGGTIPDLELVIWTRHNVAVTSEYESAWIQDTLTKDRWTITGGLRYDNQSGKNRPHFDAGTPEAQGFLPAIQFPGNDANGLEWESIVPRVGVTYALGEKQRTLLRGTFSQYAAQLGQSVISRTDPLAPYSYVYFYFYDTNQNLVFDPSEAPSLYYYYVYAVNYADPGSILSPNRNDPDLEPHMTDEMTFGIQHAFDNGIVLSANLVYRNTTDLLEFRDLVL